MLKHEVATKAPSVWMRIKELRTDTMEGLAPKFAERLVKMENHFQLVRTVGNKGKETFDPDRFETIREDELQRIYYGQGTTHAQTAIFGWHFFRLAADYISIAREWSVSDEWWEQLARIAEAEGLDSGRRWKKFDVHKGTMVPAPDNPHVQFGGLPSRPPDSTRAIYFGTGAWANLPVMTGEKHIEGLLRVWKAHGAI